MKSKRNKKICYKYIFFFIIVFCILAASDSEDNNFIEQIKIVNKKDNFKEGIWIAKKGIDIIGLKEVFLPKQIWKEVICIGGLNHEVTFERTSLPYESEFSDVYGERADYRIRFKNIEKNIVYEQLFSNYLMMNESVYWMHDISNDGISDIIMCSDYEVGQRNRYTKLLFFIWNSEEEVYELKLLNEEYVDSPIWNEGLGVIMFFEEGFNRWVNNLKAYIYIDGNWELYAEVIADSENKDTHGLQDGYKEEEYYKEMNYFHREIFYENGKVVSENISDEINWWNENSIWYIRDKQDIHLIPSEGWKLEEVESDIGIIWKYVSNN